MKGDAMAAGPSRTDRRGDRWPLVGRDDELHLARAQLEAGGSVVLTGPAGVGKTRLAQELLAGAADAGRRTQWAVATHAAATVPLGAVAHLVPAETVREGRDSTLQAMILALQQQHADERLVLGIDDAHVLDEASAALVHLLTTAGTASVVATVRSGESVPDPIVALWKDGPASLVVLQELARHEVEELATTVLGGPLEGTALHHLWESTRGNVLFLRELVHDGLESGTLACERGQWRWRGRLRPGQRLRDVVALRTGRLDDGERAVLEVVAVGEPLAPAVIRTLGAEAAADRLERRGLVTSRRAEQREMRLAHPLFGEVVRAETPLGRLDEVRLQLAAALEATGELTRADVVRVAHWRVDAGDRSRPDQFRTAARNAWAAGASPEAERLARAAFEAQPDFENGYLLGEALSDLGRSEEALETWAAVEGLPASDRLRANLALAKASTLTYQLDRGAEAAALLQATLDDLHDEDARRLIEDAAALRSAAVPSLDRATDTGRLPPLAAWASATAWTLSGQLELAVRTADEALAWSDEWVAERPGALLHLELVRIWAHGLAGHLAEATAEADQRYHHAMQDGADLARGRWCLLRGSFRTMRGRPATASVLLREACAAFEVTDMGFLRPARAYLAMATALGGNGAAAEELLGEADGANHALDQIFGAEVSRARAWAHAARGEVTAAALVAEAAAEQAAEAQQCTLEALACHDVARFGRAELVADRLTLLAGKVDGPLVDAFAAHARALADPDGPTLDEASSTFVRLGSELFAAEASAAAAAAHREAGRKPSALAASRRALELAGRCEGATTPALAWIDQPDDLTTREREVADLAAAELSSRAIGVRLGITTRTVDNLLGRVYVKLGVSGRQELVAALGRRRSD